MPSNASFATQTVVNAVVEAVSQSTDRPELTEDGTGGVYVIRSRRPSGEQTGGGVRPLSPVAVFKPSDEEAGSDNNPRGLHGEEHVMREGFHPGGGAARELVAYQLDRGFAGVPKTAIDKLLLRTRTGTRLSEQTGSIQQFVQSEGDASDYRFDGSDFCEDASQRIALQDVRLFNCDRHEGNILVRAMAQPAEPTACHEQAAREQNEQEKKLDLVPIDHAFILPSFGYFREAEFAWRYWLMAASPFGREAVKYVAGIDVDADVAIARQAGLDESSCATLRTCTMLVKAALLGSGAKGVTPKALASMLMREEIDEPSPLERLCAQALGVVDEEVGRDMALIDFVVAQQSQEDAADFVPPPEFYARFGRLLEETYGPPCAMGR